MVIHIFLVEKTDGLKPEIFTGHFPVYASYGNAQ